MAGYGGMGYGWWWWWLWLWWVVSDIWVAFIYLFYLYCMCYIYNFNVLKERIEDLLYGKSRFRCIKVAFGIVPICFLISCTSTLSGDSLFSCVVPAHFERERERERLLTKYENKVICHIQANSLS